MYHYLLYTVIGIAIYMVLFALLGWSLGQLNWWLTCRKPSAPPEKWPSKHNLKHSGVALFHLPFTPEEREVIYLENEYDEVANRFITGNLEMIRQKFREKGFRFVYLPLTDIPTDKLISTLNYYHPEGTDTRLIEEIGRISDTRRPSSYLLQYMLKSKNRSNMQSCFAWYNHSRCPFGVTYHIYDYITFVGGEAMASPESVMDEICQELGKSLDWIGGICCKEKLTDADGNFDMEIRKTLDEVQEKLDELRLRGVSESFIFQYLKKEPQLSRLVIKPDLRIYLPDYQNREVVMEPLNKAVFLLFLRHPEGLLFKELEDYRHELDVIYQAVRSRKNDIERRLARRDFLPVTNQSIINLTNPLDNSINEKCTRIKEAFLLLMHENTARHYMVTGVRGEVKKIGLPRELVTWEREEEEV